MMDAKSMSAALGKFCKGEPITEEERKVLVNLLLEGMTVVSALPGEMVQAIISQAFSTMGFPPGYTPLREDGSQGETVPVPERPREKRMGFRTDAFFKGDCR